MDVLGKLSGLYFEDCRRWTSSNDVVILYVLQVPVTAGLSRSIPSNCTCDGIHKRAVIAVLPERRYPQLFTQRYKNSAKRGASVSTS